MAKIASGSIDLKSLKVAGMNATDYITDITNNGIFVHSKDSNTLANGSGVHIGANEINIIKEGVSNIKAWVTDTIPYIRIGREDKGNVLIDDDSVDIRDTSTTVASFGINGQYFCNDNGVPILEVGKLSQSTMSRHDWFIYDGVSSPFTVSLSWQVSHINSFTWYDANGRMQSISPVGYTLNGRNIIFDTATCEEMISMSIERFSVGYDAVGRFPYYSFGSAAVGSERIGNVGIFSFREGDNTVASGKASHAEGFDTIASGEYSHAEGYSSDAIGDQSHAEGFNTEARGDRSHAEGSGTIARGDYSHAEGNGTVANGDYSHAQNYGTRAYYNYQTVIGKFNNNSEDNAFEIGNSDDELEPSNAFSVSWKGFCTAATDGAICVTDNASKIAQYFTVSKGSITSIAMYRYGKIIQLNIAFRNTASTGYGENVLEATWVAGNWGSDMRPINSITGIGVFGKTPLVGVITVSNGKLIVKNASPSAMTIGSGYYALITFTYIAANAL